MSKAFPDGITGCWLLRDGTILVEGPVFNSRDYGRFYPQHDGMALVVSEVYTPMLQEITDDIVTFIGTGDGDSGPAFPFLIIYDIEKAEATFGDPVDLPVTQGVKSGLDLPGAAQGAFLEAILLKGDSIVFRLKDTWATTRPYFEVQSDVTQKRLIVEIPDVPAGKSLALPLSIAGQGLIRSVRAEAGTSRDADKGVTVFIYLDPDKWGSLTYTQTPPSEEQAPAFILTFSNDKTPTDLTIKVKR